MAKKTDVHTRHCCKHCGCKYGDKDCTVVNGLLTQERPCGEQYVCDEDDFMDDYRSESRYDRFDWDDR